MKKKMLAVVLSAALTLGLAPAGVFAETGTDAAASQSSVDAAAADSADSNDSTDPASYDQNSEDPSTDTENPKGTEETADSDAQNASEADASPEEAPGEAEDQEQEEEPVEVDSAETLILPDPGTVTGFEIVSEEDRTIDLDEKGSFEELEKRMPETILVYLDYSSEAVEIPVTWVSEVDFDSTSESYYIFWADWDQDTYPLLEGYGVEEYFPFVEVIVPARTGMKLFSTNSTQSSGVKNIVARARQMVDIRWTPVSNVNGFSDYDTQLTVYFSGTTYNGIPYGQQVYAGTWVPNSTTFETFLDAVRTAGSPMYSARGNNGTMDSTYFANDCSSFVSYCYGLPRMTTWSFATSSQFSAVSGNSIYNAQVGDCFNLAGSHVEIITAMNYDSSGNLVSVEVSEQTPPKARTIIYTPAQVQTLINRGYTLLRYAGRNSVGSPQSYTGYSSDKSNPVKVTYSKEEQAELDFSDKNGDGSVINLTVAGLQSYSRTEYKAAVWTAENGQDDIQWITLNRQTNASYTCTIKASDFKHSGKYVIHLYKMGPLGNDCVRATEYTPIDVNSTADVTLESVAAEDVSNTTGSCRILISGVTCEDGVSRIQVPVWSASGQSDIHWYTAKQLDDTTWYVDMNISRHSYNFGTYQIHVYGTNIYGKRNFMGNTTVTFTQQPAEVTAEVNGTAVTISVKNLFLPGGIKSVLIPTWSSTGGQDDLTWVKASYDKTNAAASAVIDTEKFSHFGDFYSHVYAESSSGSLRYMGNVTYTVQEPDVHYNEVSYTFDDTTGDFTVTISYPKHEAGKVTAVTIPIWSGSNQNDLIWYKASKGTNGTWTVSGNISNHKGLGTYHCHVYGTVSSRQYFLGNTSFTAAVSLEELRLGASSDRGLTYPITVKNLRSPLAFSKVQAAVWSDAGGQDDIAWYTLKSGGTGASDLTGTINMKKHKTAGAYYIHLYGITASGKYCFIKSLEADISSSAKADITVTDEIQNDGRVSLVIEVTDNDWTYTGLKVPVWNASDQSDIVWYDAVQQEDGTWTCEIDTKNHKNHTGTYQIHTYLNYSNGIFGYIGKTRAEIA
ncbi:MAG: GBS Bsp-like repeat-containing protein [Lachnospiraceae bacterium]|nr:GBS Bsp-like repeat-containing protein [Lachnospiraceae bacterium]